MLGVPPEASAIARRVVASEASSGTLQQGAGPGIALRIEPVPEAGGAPSRASRKALTRSVMPP